LMGCLSGTSLRHRYAFFDKKDLEFVVANKVTHVINAAARQIPNHWENIKVQYLSFLWMDAEG
jgi:hypothetical protein